MQLVVLIERLATLAANVRLFAAMDHRVPLQIEVARECLLAYVALVRLGAGVRVQMLLQQAHPPELFAAIIANELEAFVARKEALRLHQLVARFAVERHGCRIVQQPLVQHVVFVEVALVAKHSFAAVVLALEIRLAAVDHRVTLESEFRTKHLAAIRTRVLFA